MAELVLYKGKPLSLGTEMNLWHVSYSKLFKAYSLGSLKQCAEANLPPKKYLAPDSVFLFRFPFTDEKDLKLNTEVDYRKAVPVNITDTKGKPQTVYISQQRCISRKNGNSAYLATLYRDTSGMLITELTDLEDAVEFTIQIVINNIFSEPDTEKQTFYTALVNAILGGYHQSITLPEK